MICEVCYMLHHALHGERQWRMTDEKKEMYVQHCKSRADISGTEAMRRLDGVSDYLKAAPLAKNLPRTGAHCYSPTTILQLSCEV